MMGSRVFLKGLELRAEDLKAQHFYPNPILVYFSLYQYIRQPLHPF